jgi:hypothetical protein
MQKPLIRYQSMLTCQAQPLEIQQECQPRDGHIGLLQAHKGRE